MQSLNIRINAADLADVLGAMREWLDHNHLDLGAFRYGNDGPAHAIIHVELADPGQAELFRTRFSDLSV